MVCTRRNTGFTLMELLVTLTLMILLMGVVVRIAMGATDTVLRSQAVTRIHTIGRHALGRIGADLDGAVIAPGADLRVGRPRAAGPGRYGGPAIFDQPAHGQANAATAPFLTVDCRARWIDVDGSQRSGIYKVAYRVVRGTQQIAGPGAACVLERTLNQPGPGPLVPVLNLDGDPVLEDVCGYVLLDSAGVVHLAFEVWDEATSRFVQATSAATPLAFGPGQPVPFNRLPVSLRISMDVVDMQDREVRTLARQVTLAGR